jgi:hypothetical protein
MVVVDQTTGDSHGLLRDVHPTFTPKETDRYLRLTSAHRTRAQNVGRSEPLAAPYRTSGVAVRDFEAQVTRR